MSAHPPLRVLGRLPRKRVGLFGGSFNPAHDGHAYIAREALKRLDLDEIWFLVSPQNPLKTEAGMAPLDARLAATRRICGVDSRLRALALESELGTRYTADSLAVLRARFAKTRFVWLMGADNLVQFHRWRGWRRIFHTMVIAVFARPAYDVKALAGKAARALSTARVAPRRARSLAAFAPPAWTFFPVRHHPASATRLRAQGKGGSARRGEGVG
ncbi:MAG: nicotinate-nucleotide adenylyltransferase [Tagaea sp.]|nr:nicotinate-nucleotide adenylyltransferase [Tagaea sp.]